jgi:hypothetical protein
MSDSALACYRVNEPSVIHQAIDGELVVIHLDNGVYYSLDATGARIWAMLAAGQPVRSVIDSFSRVGVVDSAGVTAAVTDLVDRLCAEELLVANGAANGTTQPIETDLDVSFSPPVLQRYDDLQDLLLLDPIHAVDESGWPDRRDGA